MGRLFMRTPGITAAAAFAAALAGAAPPAWTQERYDGREPLERFSVRVGGYCQTGHESTIRIDSTALGLGTLIELEDQLDVEDTVSIARIDGFYRFNPRHRIDWSYYRSKREGISEVINEELQIGDEVFDIGSVIETVWKTTILKAGWSYSFINVRKYEFWIGAGLNFRDISLGFDGTLSSGGTVTEEKEDEDAALPLPTFSFGGRWNFTDKWKLDGKYEWFSLRLGDIEGGLQEATVLLEHSTFAHVGFGGGLSSFLSDLEYEGWRDFRGELEKRYIGFLLYLKIH